MRRSASPLHKNQHAKYLAAILEHDNQDRSIACHLGIGTGGRADTICHVHSSWFYYDDNNNLYLRIPASDPCRKNGNHKPCGDCQCAGHTEYAPKTPAGEGRPILITNEWTNHVTGEREYFGLRDAVESYFALTGPNAPNSVKHGNAMISGDGICKSTLNRWARKIGAESTVRKVFRRDTLEKDNSVDSENIKDFGLDSNGNEIPDLFSHDFRASFCTQLMRCSVQPSKAIKKTGHENEETLYRYAQIANSEIDADDEATFY